jgi:hypothetical protein
VKVKIVMLFCRMNSGLDTAHLASTCRAVCLVSGLGLVLMQLRVQMPQLGVRDSSNTESNKDSL